MPTPTSRKEGSKLLVVSFMRKNGHLPEGFYAFKKPNTWYLLAYVRKAKNAKDSEYHALINHIKL